VAVGVSAERRGLRPLLALVLLALGHDAFALATPVDFWREVAPILEDACLSCHGTDKVKAELRLDTRAAALAGGLSGPAVIPGHGGKSLLVQRLLGEGGEDRMPLERPALSPREIATIRRWIDEGASWPQGQGTWRVPSVSTTAAAGLRRLTTAEYERTVEDLLGVGDGIAGSFPADPFIGGFDNNAEGLVISTVHAERYREIAEKLAASALATAAGRNRVLGCEPTGQKRTACLRAFVERFARRAYRRKPTADETAPLLSLANRASRNRDAYAGPRLVVTAVLQSPNFLFRTERGEPEPHRPGWRRLRGPELASRLSYLLLGATPGDDLLAAADEGGLDSAEGLEDVARAMLRDRRARPALRAFYGQWFKLQELENIGPCETRATCQKNFNKYKVWHPSLRQTMREETERVVDDFIWTPRAHFLDVLTARHGYVDQRLAAVYRVAPPANDQPWRRVEFQDGDERGGLLTQASVLTITGRNPSAAAIARGKYVREVLLCQELPPPPPNVPTLPESKKGEPHRARLERHRTDPTCGGCHKLLDPLGFGLERYDDLGQLQTKDADKPLTGQGNLFGWSAPGFSGPFELARKLQESPLLERCVVRQSVRYALGRLETPEDAPMVDEVTKAFRRAGHSFLEMMVALVRSDGFRFTREGTP
jgi:hypothetical protein